MLGRKAATSAAEPVSPADESVSPADELVSSADVLVSPAKILTANVLFLFWNLQSVVAQTRFPPTNKPVASADYDAVLF